MRQPFLAALLLMLLVALSAAPLSARADGCYNCCEQGNDCGYAYDNSDVGHCCGRQGSTVYCCPASLECGQTYEDAVCVRPGSGQVATYAYHYTPGSSALAAWIIVLIVIGGLCCCAALCFTGYRKRQYFNRGWGGGQPAAQAAYTQQPGPAPYTVAESYPQGPPGTYAQPPPPYGQPYQQGY